MGDNASPKMCTPNTLMAIAMGRYDMGTYGRQKIGRNNNKTYITTITTGNID